MTRQHHNLRYFRQTNGLKQRELSALLGISNNLLMRYERGFEEIPPSIVQSIDDISSRPIDINTSVEEISCGEGYVTAKPNSDATIRRSSNLITGQRYVMDLFCGVGGFSHGFESTGKFQVSAGIDLLGDRLSTFTANHKSANAYGSDIRNLSIGELDRGNPKPFVIIGGPPCQGFSSLRPFRNVDWNDPRNNLGEEFVRVVAAFQPDWIVFENVVGLLTHNGGKTLDSINSAFEALGYRTSMRILNGAQFGLPQRRERLIIIGSRAGKAVDWPDATHHFVQRSMAGKTGLLIPLGKDSVKAVTFDDATNDLPELASGEKATCYGDATSLTKYQETMRLRSKSLKLHEATRHSDKMLEIIKHSGANIHALPPGLVKSGFSSCYSRLAGNEPSTTMTVNFVHPASNRCIHPTQDRALTPREGARLQSFEDNFEFIGSRSQIVKQIGNAVPPLLGRVIADTIIRSD